ncbi:unnamed protein product [Linum trigynum]|uniref:F-box/LRR-repeat protein 15/At3g58940/PEG3-like LRR domain-containing protein n=1 Tax=Linum trigynum TaxID=586398 RepID=A0AAV2GE46_9ROSI
MNKIHEAVLLHNSNPTTKVVLAIPGLIPCDEIDHFILYLANNKVLRDFTLRILDESGRYVYDLRNFPSLFAAIELSTLKLHSCEFRPPPGFVGFNKLTHLELNNIMLDEDFFVDFVTKCPLLEDLRIIDCCGLGAPLGIDAPRLKVLCFRVILRSIWFKYTPLLSLVSILDERDYLSNKLYDDQQDSVDIVDVFASLPALQELKLGIEFLQLRLAILLPYSALFCFSPSAQYSCILVLFSTLVTCCR